MTRSRPRAWLVPAALFGLVAGCKDLEPIPPDDAPSTGAIPALAPEAVCEGFQAVGDRVEDRSTGLVWDRFVVLSLVTHAEAVAQCEAQGARLPTRQELAALRRPGRGDPCQLPACPFRGDRCATLQCGTAIGDTDTHWGIAFSGGAELVLRADQPEAVICVR